MDPADCSLRQLIEVVPPPSRKPCPGRLDSFAVVERELGLSLPTGFKELTEAYGTGVWFETIFVLNPFERSPVNGERWWCFRGYCGGPAWCAAERASPKQFPNLYVYPVYPEPGGVFPWAFLQDGGVLYWLTEGSPEVWRTLDDRLCPVCRRRRGESYQMTVPELLLNLATDAPDIRERELRSRCLPYLDRGFQALHGG